MLIALAVAVVVIVVLLLVILKRRSGAAGRGDLLGPPPGLGAKVGIAPPQPRAPPAGGARPAPFDDLPEPVVAEARRLMAQNRKLEAVKLIREAKPAWSLGEAKGWVERL